MATCRDGECDGELGACGPAGVVGCALLSPHDVRPCLAARRCQNLQVLTGKPYEGAPDGRCRVLGMNAVCRPGSTLPPAAPYPAVLVAPLIFGLCASAAIYQAVLFHMSARRTALGACSGGSMGWPTAQRPHGGTAKRTCTSRVLLVAYQCEGRQVGCSRGTM